MLRWTMDMPTVVDAKKVDAAVAVESEDRLAPDALFNYVVATLATALARVGVTSAAAMVAIALLVATVLLGLTTTDAAAIGQFCSRC